MNFISNFIKLKKLAAELWKGNMQVQGPKA